MRTVGHPTAGGRRDVGRADSCLRKITELSTMLPAWLDHAPADLAQELRQTLARMLNPDDVVVKLRDGQLDEASDRALGERRPLQQRLAFPASIANTRVTRLPIGDDGAFGNVLIGTSRTDFPDEYDTLLLQVAARHAATALRYQALLHCYRETEQVVSTRFARQESVTDLGLRAVHGFSLDELLCEAGIVLRRMLGVDYTEVLQLESDGSFRLRCGSGWPSSLIGMERVASSDCAASFAVRSREPVVVNDLTSETRFRASALESTYHVMSGICVLIHGDAEVFGVLGAHSRERRLFTQPDLLFQQSIANILSSAVQRRQAEARREALLARTTAAQEESERASRAKSEFLGMLGHELRTPLNAMAGYLDLMDSGMHGPVTDAQRQDLARIRRSQHYLLNLINNVLSFLKLGNGRVRYDIVQLKLAELFPAIEEMIRPVMETHGLMYTQFSPPPDTCVVADREKVQQILLNLLSNAAKFTDRGGSVGLDYTLDDGIVHVHVRDTGRGVPPEMLKAIFEPFVRVEVDRARSVEGTGLGLAISREFAIGMGGQLRADSQLGKGSTFTLSLPTTRAAPT